MSAAAILSASGIWARMRARASSSVAPSQLAPGDLGRLGGRDDHQGTERVRQAVLDEQRGLVAGERLAFGGERLAREDTQHGDLGMNDAVQQLSLRFVGEHDVRQRLAVEHAVRPEHGGPEGHDDGEEPLGPLGHRVPGQLIGVDDRQPPGPKPGGDRALARRDSSRHPEDVHALFIAFFGPK